MRRRDRKEEKQDYETLRLGDGETEKKRKQDYETMRLGDGETEKKRL
jgi:hypothetical protein